MAKPSYKYYAIYMLQSYIQAPKQRIQTEANKLNCEATEAAISELNGRNKDIITRVFGSRERLERSVDGYSAETGISQQEVWHVIKSTCRRVAEIRGLV